MREQALAHGTHTQRAHRHHKVGCAIADSGDEWAAVCFFYSAYHLAKAALLQDPIFDDVGRLHQKHLDLIPDDRFTDRHHVRTTRGERRGWGVNELVQLLYPSMVADYEKLHSASVSVRYRAGLPADAVPSLRASVDRIRAAAANGELVASD